VSGHSTMSDDRLKNLLHSAFPQPDGQKPSRDLWPSIVDRIQAPAAWSWLDMSVAAAVVAGVVIALWMLPKALLLLAYNL
jgi:hypothetical protein